MPTILFMYYIAPRGGGLEQALVKGSLYTSSFDSAKKHVQTVSAPKVEWQPNLEVILRDIRGSEIWRAPYLGKGS